MYQALIITLFISFLSASCAHKKEAEKSLFAKEENLEWFGNIPVKRLQLHNGLKVVILENHSAPTFSYQTWFNVGSMDEDPERTGLAHLFEHMMFKATKNYKDGEFDKILESAGAEGENAFTNRDYTAYIQSMPVSSKNNNLDLIMKMESDRMVNLIVDKDVLDKEREVVQNERRFRNENNPDGKLFEQLYETAYHRHSYHWPVIGYENHLAITSVEDCMQFYKNFYAPNNATVVIVGDVNTEEVKKTLLKYYDELPSSPVNRREILVEPPQEKERKVTLKLKTEVEKLVIAYRMPEVQHPDFATFELIANILSNGRSSRLYNKLVDTGIATDIDTDISDHKNPGLFMFWVNLQKGRKADEALKVIDHEVKLMTSGKISNEEMIRSLAQMRYETFDGLTSNERKAHFIGNYETVANNFQYGVQLVNFMKNIKKEEVIRVTGHYFRPELRTILIGVSDIEKSNQRNKK